MKTFFALLLFFSVLFVEAQLSFTPSKTFVMYLNKNKLHYDGIMIHNQSNDTVNLKWELVSIDTIPGSYFDFCASGECYLGIPAQGTFPKINPLDSGWAKMHFWTGNITGTCKAVIYVYEIGNIGSGDTLTYFLHVTEPNIIKESLISYSPIIYPNPASIFLNIKMPAESSYNYSIFDITGKELKTAKAKGDCAISLSEFPVGLYVLRVKDFIGNTSIKKFNINR